MSEMRRSDFLQRRLRRKNLFLRELQGRDGGCGAIEDVRSARPADRSKIDRDRRLRIHVTACRNPEMELGSVLFRLDMGNGKRIMDLGWGNISGLSGVAGFAASSIAKLMSFNFFLIGSSAVDWIMSGSLQFVGFVLCIVLGAVGNAQDWEDRGLRQCLRVQIVAPSMGNHDAIVKWILIVLLMLFIVALMYRAFSGEWPGPLGEARTASFESSAKGTLRSIGSSEQAYKSSSPSRNYGNFGTCKEPATCRGIHNQEYDR